MKIDYTKTNQTKLVRLLDNFKKIYKVLNLNLTIEVYLIYNVVLITAVQQRDSIIHIVCKYINIYTFFFKCFSITIYHRILNSSQNKANFNTIQKQLGHSNITKCSIHKKTLHVHVYHNTASKYIKQK